MKDMKKKGRAALQWAAFVTLCGLWTVAFILVVGVLVANNPLSWEAWLLLKACGLAAFAIFTLLGLYLHANGLLPRFLDKLIGEEE